MVLGDGVVASTVSCLPHGQSPATVRAIESEDFFRVRADLVASSLETLLRIPDQPLHQQPILLQQLMVCSQPKHPLLTRLILESREHSIQVAVCRHKRDHARLADFQAAAILRDTAFVLRQCWADGTPLLLYTGFAAEEVGEGVLAGYWAVRGGTYR